MATREKILRALESALAFLDDSMLAIDRKDDNLLADIVWHVAAELEYALFLFSIMVQGEIEKSKWKLHQKTKKAEVASTLTAVQDLLADAEKCARNEKLLAAYKSAYIARSYTLKLQKSFAKKKREALKKKK